MHMENLQLKEKRFARVDNLMWKVTKLLYKTKKSILDEFDLTCSQYEILAAIHQFSEKNNDVIQINLSEKTHIDPMTTSTVLRNLQKRGLIKRERGLVNTRTVEVKITDAGKYIYDLARKKIDKMQEEIYQNLDCPNFFSQLSLLSDKLNKSKLLKL